MKLPIAGARDFSRDKHAMEYDNPQFWDSAHLQSELHRVFEICNGCRLCFNLCPSFDVLFRRIDALDPHAEEAEGKHLEEGRIVEEHEAAKLLEHVKVRTESPVALLQDDDKQRVVELCYECKLCYPKCPYVPPHEFAVDFPKLMLRSKMIDARDEGIGLREKFLGATDLVGSVMTKIAPLANVAAHNKFNRMLMDQTIGIAKDRQLPAYADESFETWWGRRAPVAASGDQPVALFFTCFVNYNDPAIGKDAVAMLEKAGCDVDCPEQVCCGMPRLDGGDLDGARKLAARNVEALLPHVRAGKKVLSPGPSCTLVLRTEYPELVPTPEAKEVSVTMVDRCCGMDGTWGMKSEFFEESLKVAEPAARKVDEAEPDAVSSDCPLAGLQLRQKTGRRVYHPVRILRAAYDEPLRSPKT
jgi:Fe-S oxidoreductase